MRIVVVTLVLAGWFAPCGKAQQVVDADVCIYGGTSAGVAAASQTARMGKSVVLLEPGKHLGGLSSGGLGQTDIGNKGAIGGISRDFYRRLGAHYGKEEQWTFEPHVAENTFQQMIEEADVPVYFEQRLASVRKTGARLVAITMENGNTFRARMFIDATYEGDLMAKAGVSYHVGREANAVYDETLNGIRASTPLNQLTAAVDPYVIPGDPSSGLLPLIQEGDGGVPGEGDHRVQAYNFRMCLTQVETNKIPIAPPADYDPARYELLARYIEARVARGDTLQLRQFFKLDMMPNGKTDSNNEGGFSTDYIGYNYDYPEASYERRAEIWKEHEDYLRGFFTFLATSPRVPAYLRTAMQSWGLPKDEFQDTGGWPHQLYVREARRMISDYVMTEHNCRGTVTAEDPVGLAAYSMDSHNVQRIVQGGVARNEGDVQVWVSPYPISYRSIVPRAAECENLLVPVCLSSSHIAYGSIRMEPVFMILAQSAATAACFAMDDGVPVQEVDYARLKMQLIADKQVLQWGGSGNTEPGIVVDNSDATGVTISGEWSTSSSVSGFLGANYLHDGNSGKGTKSVRFTPVIPTNGVYPVYMRWTTDPNRAGNVPVDIIHAGGTSTVSINQRNQNGQWVSLGNFTFNSGTSGSVVVRTSGTDGYVVADAVRFGDAAPDSTVSVIATDAEGGEFGVNQGQISFHREGPTNAPLTVLYSVSGSATNGADFEFLDGTVTIPAGALVASIPIVPLMDSLAEGEETVVLTVSPSTGYVAGSFNAATVTIQDKPWQQWQKSQFTQDETIDPSISGPDADPDNDSLRNMIEYAFGTNPKLPNAPRKSKASIVNNQFRLQYERSRFATDLEYVVESSEDLVTWNPVSNPLGEYLLSDADETETRMLIDEEVHGTDGKFISLRVRFAP